MNCIIPRISHSLAGSSNLTLTDLELLSLYSSCLVPRVATPIFCLLADTNQKAVKANFVRNTIVLLTGEESISGKVVGKGGLKYVEEPEWQKARAVCNMTGCSCPGVLRRKGGWKVPEVGKVLRSLSYSVKPRLKFRIRKERAEN